MDELKFTYDAPKWAKTSGFVKQLALWCDIECKVEVTKGWLRESGTIACKGSNENIMKFKDEFEVAMSEYNNH